MKQEERHADPAFPVLRIYVVAEDKPGGGVAWTLTQHFNDAYRKVETGMVTGTDPDPDPLIKIGQFEQYIMKFILCDNTDPDLRLFFMDSGPGAFTVRNDGNCPQPNAADHLLDEFQVIAEKPKRVKVINWNRLPGNYKYRLRIKSARDNGRYDYDPVIQNGGGGVIIGPIRKERRSGAKK